MRLSNEFLSLSFVSLLLTLMIGFLPYLTFRREAFGVSVPDACCQHPALVSLRARYRNSSLLIGAGILLVLAALFWTGKASPQTGGFALLLQLAALFGCYLYFHRRAKALKAQQGWDVQGSTVIAVDLSPDSRKFIPGCWLLLFPLVILLTGLLGFAAYPGAPDRLTTHWEGWGWSFTLFSHGSNAVGKSPGIIWAVLLLQTMMACLFTFLFFIIRNARRQYDPERFEESVRQSSTFRRAWGYFLIGTGLMIELLFGAALAAVLEVIAPEAAVLISILSMALILGSALVLSFWLGQGGNRMRPASGCACLQDDRYWKLGTLYFNPDDPAVFVEKRFGIGWTCNFARPASWAMLFGLIGILWLASWFCERLLG